MEESYTGNWSPSLGMATSSWWPLGYEHVWNREYIRESRHANGEIDIKGFPQILQKTPEKLEDKSDEKSAKDIGTNSTGTGKKGDNAVCDVCGEAFRTVSLAISHKFRKHPESVIKHYCPHCGMMFPIKLNRDKHLLTHPGTAPKQLYPCLTCGVAFYNQRARKFHMDSAHKGEVVQCNLCSALFYSKRAYDAHSHHHRESDLFATNEEMRQQVVQRIDQDFDQRRVPSTVERYLSASAVSLNRSATWRNIQAARRAQVTQESPVSSETFIQKDISLSKDSFVETSSKVSMVHHPETSLKEEVNSPLLSTSGLGMSEENIAKAFDDDHEKRTINKGVSSLIQGENMCWGSEERVASKKRMLDDPEEDDCDISSLGTVNPDSVMSNPRVMAGECSSSDGILGESTEERLKESSDVVKYIDKEERNRETNRSSLLFHSGCHVEGRDSDGSDSGELVVEKIVGMHRNVHGREFLVRWRGFEPADDTWEREEFLNCNELISDFLKNKKTKASVQSGDMAIEWYDTPRHKRQKERQVEDAIE
ncbi:MDS1 and EVI1 complex locus protein EVI1-A-like isoform X4 [Homarus americanus]|uniref:MDS1 and EVI1 complex locus protein EVI1-A-like isoform X4 n=1 Tax=Homarus americanus TaxID=6706 RepID=UPI001C452314|nr:MDS1 and EVI1 complex locus protein EVI1-A-like isoform X4 [Homarus americanus]